MRHSGLSWTPMLGLLVLAVLTSGCPGSTPSTTTTSSPSPTPVRTEMGVIVRLVDHTGTDPEKPELSGSTGTDHIRWSNETSVDRKIHFTVDWPFMEASGDITVTPGAKSAWFTFDPAKVSGGGKPFPYEVYPPLASAPTDGPDEPQVSGEP